MLDRRLTLPVLAAAFLGLSACGGTTQFAGAQPFQIAGTPPPPPPVVVAPPPKVEEPKPPPRVELRDNKIVFNEKIQFEVNKAVIKEESFSLLHDIGDVIKKNPQVKKISIEGHASSEGDPKKNKKLSDDRAKSVMDHLVKKEGVEATRLAAKGWGIEKPIASNDDETGREKNRRVEFLVTEQDVTKKQVEIDPTTGKERVVGETKETMKVEAPVEAPPAVDPTKPAPKKPDAAKPEAKKPDATKPVEVKKPLEKKPDATKPAEKK
jgi:OOP family OmpA-OmpF porin